LNFERTPKSPISKNTLKKNKKKLARSISKLFTHMNTLKNIQKHQIDTLLFILKGEKNLKYSPKKTPIKIRSFKTKTDHGKAWKGLAPLFK